MDHETVMPADALEQLLGVAEQKRRCAINALEQVLSIGDFQKQIDHPIEPRDFIQLTAERINDLIQFEVGAMFFVDQPTSRIDLACCIPHDLQHTLEKQYEHLIEQGYVAWALREPRGIMVYSEDGRYRVLLHIMTTYSRIRGLFMGLLPAKSNNLPDGSLQALSLILRNAANALESIEYLSMFQRQNAELQTKVDQKVGELRQHDLQLLNARKMDAVSTLAGGIAHQYNNALAVLVGNLDLIRLELANARSIDKYIDRIDAVSQNMQELTAKLSAYARGGKHLPQTVYLEALVDDALRCVCKKLEIPIEVELRLPSGTYSVQVDVTQMQLALSAIITNGVEAFESSGRIAVKSEKVCIADEERACRMGLAQGDYVLLEISDNGKGMDDNTREHIFDPFFTTKFTGRGLSMAAAYGIVKNHHGELAVESTVGQGTTVRMYLPLAVRAAL